MGTSRTVIGRERRGGRTRAALSAGAVGIVALSLLTGCGGDATVSPAAGGVSSPAAGAGSSDAGGGGANASASGARAVPGFAPGEIPPIPLLTIPDISLLTDSPSQTQVDLTSQIGSVPGVTVSPAACDGSGRAISAGGGSVTLSGDGALTASGPDGQVVNGGDGSGTISKDGVTITNGGDGSGTYSSATTTITVDSDGSGTYKGPEGTVTVGGDGSGTSRSADGATTITVDDDGSGSYSSGAVHIVNAGDGSGSYSDGTITIINDGHGTARVDGRPVKADPLPPVPKAGRFPALDKLAPQKSCGVKITLEDGVLFDFGKADLRPASAETLKNLSSVLVKIGSPTVTIEGHTDSIGEDAFNQDLSERRAEAVRAALASDGVTAGLTAVGYGETRPVAPNTAPDGSDNPAGRQLNRRVEIIVQGP